MKLETHLNVRNYTYLHRDLKALGDQNAATINLNRGDKKPSRFNDRLLSTTMGSDVSDDLAVQAGRKLELRSAIRGKIVGIYRKCLFALKDKKLPVLRAGGEDGGGEVKKSRRGREMVYEVKGDKDDVKWQWRKDFGDNDDDNDNDNENGEVDDEDILSHPSCTSPFDHDRDGGYRSFSTSEFTSSQADPRTFLDVTGKFSRTRGGGVGGGGGSGEGGDGGRGVRGERGRGAEEKLRQGQGQEEEGKGDGKDESKGEGREAGEGKEEREGDEYDLTKNILGFPGPRTCSWLDAELGMLRGLYECEIRMLEDVIRKLRTTPQDSSPKRKSKNSLLSTNKSSKKPILDRKWKQQDDFVVRHVSEKEQPLPSPRTFLNRTL